MKILFFNSGFLPSRGGVATFSYEWVVHAAQQKEVDSAHVIAFGNPAPRDEKITQKLRVKAIASRNIIVIGLYTLWYYIQSIQNKHYHATNLFPVGFWVVLWAQIFRKKSFVTFYGTDACADTASNLATKLRGWTIKNADQAFTISEFTKKKVCEKYTVPDSQIAVIYPGISESSLLGDKPKEEYQKEAERIKSARNIMDDDFIILSVAQLAKRKGLDQIIEAVAKTQDKTIKVFLIGSGPEQERLKQQIKKYHLEKQVFLEGKVDSVIPYYKVGNILVLNSYYRVDEGDFEGLGLVMLEAQSFGLPVIGAMSGGIPETFAEGKTGFGIPERDVQALKTKIHELKNNHEVYKKMAKETKHFVAEHFSWDQAMKEYIKSITI